jgi:hypothetical protein
MTTIAIALPGAGFDPAWLIDAGYSVVEANPDAVIFAPTSPPVTSRQRVAIAFLPVVRDDGFHVAPDAVRHAAVRADAYASCRYTLIDALRFALSEDRAARRSGPLRLTWLGPLGELFPQEPRIGSHFPIASSLLVGRSAPCDVQLRQGPHSDQCSVARQHAKLERTDGGVIVRDLGSTNGVFLRGERVQESMVMPGEEIAICGTLRLRLDGEP